MTTYPFVPSTSGAPSFQPTLDGNPYTVTIVWSLFGQRYYVQCTTLQGALIFLVALTESPGGQAIETLAWNELTGNVEGTTPVPHGYSIGATIELTISGATPSQYNGQQLVFITGTSSFEYPLDLALDPGPATTPGALSYDISLCAGYFDSTMVFRNSAFEITP